MSKLMNARFALQFAIALLTLALLPARSSADQAMTQEQLENYMQNGSGDLDANDLQYLTSIGRAVKVVNGNTSVLTSDKPNDWGYLSPKERAGLHDVINDPQNQSSAERREAYVKSFIYQVTTQAALCLWPGADFK